MTTRQELVSSFFAFARFTAEAAPEYWRRRTISLLKAVSCVLISACLFSLPLPAADDDQGNKELFRIKTTYEKEIQKLSSPDLQEIVTEQDKYLAALKSIQKKVQSAGNLEKLLAVNKEIDRFSLSRKVDADDLSKDLPDLVPFQNSYMRATGKLSAERARKIVALADNYEKALDTLQVSLTKKDDIRGAVEVKTEKDFLTNSAELMEARALIIEIDAQEAREKPSEKNVEELPNQQKPAEKEPAKTAAGSTTPVRKKYTGNPEKRISQRFDDLSKYILKQDFFQASKLADPAAVKEADVNKLRQSFMDIFPFLQLPSNPSRKLRIASLTMTDKPDTATLVPELWAGYQWNALPVTKWIETEGDWYLDISGGGTRMRPGDLIRLERSEQSKPWNRKGGGRILPNTR